MKRRMFESVKHDPTYLESFPVSFQKFKKCRKFCDVVVTSGGIQFHTHRIILAASTRYFEEQISEPTQVSTTPIIDLNDTPPEILASCIDFIYSGKIDFSGKNVERLLEASQRLGLCKLADLCVEFMSENIELESCAKVIDLCHFRSQAPFNDRMKAFLSTNFRDFLSHSSFVPLCLDKLIYCLKLLRGCSRELEMQKWNGILAWIKSDLENRNCHFISLFRCIDLTRLPKYFLHDMLREPMVSSSSICLHQIISVVTNDNLGWSQASVGQNMTHMIAYKLESQVIVKYHFATRNWSRFATFPGQFNNHCDVITHGSNIYVGTGSQIYAFVDGKWDSKMFNTKVTCKKCRNIYWHVGRKEDVIEFAGSVWMLGSITPRKVEAYTEMTNCVVCHSSFGYGSPLDYGNSSYAPPVESCHNRCIVIAGVIYMVTRDCLIEYSLESQKISCHAIWTGLGDGFFIAASKKKIYAMGGVGSGKNAVEYDITTKQCRRLSDMLNIKESGHAFWYSKKLFVFGGSYPCSLECYNPHMNNWFVVPSLSIFHEPQKIFVGDVLYLVNCKSMRKKYEAMSLAKLKKLSYPEQDDAADEGILPVVENFVGW